MKPRLVAAAKRALVGLALVAATLFAARVWQSERGAPLRPWHTYLPDEPRADAIDELDWAGYLKAEAAIFDRMRRELGPKLDAEDRVPANRYYEGSPLYPGRFPHDWNRSYLLVPDGAPAGAAVFLHGLTDGHYSLRHIAGRYRDRGYVAVSIRLPGHGTVPGALTEVTWKDWQAAARLAVREAVRRAGPGKPLHLVGYSNGGALAVIHALDASSNTAYSRPDRLVLISSMIGITGFARFAGMAGLPAALPRFAKAAWLDVLPEFNPFKYNSFPVNGARQSHALTLALQERMRRAAREGRLAGLPSVLTFQSVLDFTVLTSAVVSGLYVQLPANGSELVLFDLNRASGLSPLLRASSETGLTRLLPPAPRPFRTTVVTNASASSAEAVARTTEAGRVDEASRPLVSGRRLLAVARRPAVPGERRALRQPPRPWRGLRGPPGRVRGAWRARRPDPEPGLAPARLLEPLLLLHARAHRRGPAAHQRAQAEAEAYIENVAGGQAGADQIASAKKLLDAGTINQDEFAKLNAKALA